MERSSILTRTLSPGNPLPSTEMGTFWDLQLLKRSSVLTLLAALFLMKPVAETLLIVKLISLTPMVISKKCLSQELMCLYILLYAGSIRETVPAVKLHKVTTIHRPASLRCPVEQPINSNTRRVSMGNPHR